MIPAQVCKTFNDIRSVNIPVFAEARAYIEKICRGAVDPATVQGLDTKARRLMESRKSKGKPRPSRHLTMSGNATVRRPSGLLVPPKYKDV